MKLNNINDRQLATLLAVLFVLVLVLILWNLVQSSRIDTLSEHINIPSKQIDIVHEMRTCES